MNHDSRMFLTAVEDAVDRDDAYFTQMLPDISDDVARKLSEDMENNGFAVLENYISVQLVARLQTFVCEIVKKSGGEYVALSSEDGIKGTLLEKIGQDFRFLNLLRKIYEKGCREKPPSQTLYQVLRCLNGKSGQEHAYIFHFDSYVITALLPIVVPESGNKGGLIMLPNLRKIRSSYFFNLIDKILIDNRLSQILFRMLSHKGKIPLVSVPITPGNIYFFWGYRSLHANEACDPDKIRATALFHFGDPHVNSNLRKYMGKVKITATDNIKF
jgi:hypothetical protein